VRGVKIECLLNMVKVIQSSLARKQVDANNRDAAKSSNVEATDAVVAMAAYTFDMIWELFGGLVQCGILNGNGNAAASGAVGFSSIYFETFEVPRVNNTLAVGISRVLGETCASKDGQIDMKIIKVQQSKL
jgi:hypothetical protein